MLSRWGNNVRIFFFFFMAREFDGFYSLFLLVESKESLNPEGGGGLPYGMDVDARRLA